MGIGKYFHVKPIIFVRGQNREFSFFLIETKKSVFSAKLLIGKCQISKRRVGPWPPSTPPLPTTMVVRIHVIAQHLPEI